MSARTEQNFADYDSSFQQWFALKLLNDGTAENAGDLARELGLTSGGATKRIDALEARGWVERGRSADDRRQVFLSVTPEGINEIGRLTAVLVATWNEILSAFSESELKEFVGLLTRLKQSLQLGQSAQMKAAE
jgi:DNA-binding MarR family transcriptional regulator